MRGTAPSRDWIVACRHICAAYRKLLLAETVEDIEQAAVDAARELLGVEASWLAIRDGDVLRIASHVGLHNVEMPRTWELEVGEGVGGQVAATGKPEIIRDYKHDRRRIAPVKSIIDQEGFVSGVLAPLRRQNTVDGVLYVAVRERREFSEDEVNLLVDLAHDTSERRRAAAEVAEIALERIRAREEASALTDSLRLHAEMTDMLLASSGIEEALQLLANRVGVGVRVVDESGVELGSAGAVGDGTCQELPIPCDGDFVGTLQVHGDGLDRCHHLALDGAARVLALELERKRTALETELRLDARFFDDLLGGGVRTEELLSRASLLGVDLGTPGTVACVGAHTGRQADDGQPPALTRRVVEVLKHCVSLQVPHALVTLHMGNAVVLLKGFEDQKKAKWCIQQIRDCAVETLGGMELAVGLGRLCRQLADYPKAYREATIALELAKARGSSGQVLTPQDLGIYGLLAEVTSPKSLRSIVKSALGELVEEDTEGGSDYVTTLTAYFTNDGHMANTADALHVHVNTLRYRLKRIEEILDTDLKDPDTRFMLELAIRVNEISPQV